MGGRYLADQGTGATANSPSMMKPVEQAVRPIGHHDRACVATLADEDMLVGRAVATIIVAMPREEGRERRLLLPRAYRVLDAERLREDLDLPAWVGISVVGKRHRAIDARVSGIVASAVRSTREPNGVDDEPDRILQELRPGTRRWPRC
jgi:hypothetical protein